MKVLIIEDSRTEALRARLILEREGFQVCLAANGKEGLAQAASYKPDLIVMDTVMPEMGGFEACGKLKLDPQTQAIPILMLVSEGEADDMPSGPGLPCILNKPYDPRALVARLKELGPATSADPTPHVDPSSSETARLQEELNRAREEIERGRRTRSDLLANMSHELRTPLHEIMGMTDLLLGTDLDAEQQGYINTTRISSNALLSLIGDVIEFSELEAGQLGLDEKEFELSEPIQRTVEIMGPRAADKGLELSTALSVAAPKTLVGDANRLRQVLANLVANACKFTEAGEVQVRADVESQSDGQAVLQFRVRDTGIGIPADRLDVIFEPFQQVDVSATRRFGGMGMGLALAKQLVTLMGGRIWAESQVGRGSTFHFTAKLKVPARAAQSAATPVSTALPWPRPLQILVAEDSPTNQLIAKSSLKKAGHTVTIAVNGLEAVKAFDASRQTGGARFDLVLMDVSMPEMDGLEATRAIRERESKIGGHIVIVAMTAFATKEYHEKCLASGMDAYVTKPVRVDDLSQTLEPLMTRAAPPPPLPAAPAPDAPVVLKEALEVVGGDVDILRDAVQLSLEEVPVELQFLKEALQCQDTKGVEAKAHRLKGVMGNVGGLAACQIGQRLETMGEKGNLTGSVEVAALFEKEIGRVVAFYADPKWEALALAEVENGDQDSLRG